MKAHHVDNTTNRSSQRVKSIEDGLDDVITPLLTTPWYALEMENNPDYAARMGGQTATVSIALQKRKVKTVPQIDHRTNDHDDSGIDVKKMKHSDNANRIRQEEENVTPDIEIKKQQDLGSDVRTKQAEAVLPVTYAKEAEPFPDLDTTKEEHVDPHAWIPEGEMLGGYWMSSSYEEINPYTHDEFPDVR